MNLPYHNTYSTRVDSTYNTYSTCIFCICLSAVVLAFVKSEGKKMADPNDMEREPLINSVKKTSLSGSLNSKLVQSHLAHV